MASARGWERGDAGGIPSDARTSTRSTCRVSDVSCASGWALFTGTRVQAVVSEGLAERGRRRVLGWAQGGCRVGESISDPQSRLERPHLGLEWAARQARVNQKNRGYLGMVILGSLVYDLTLLYARVGLTAFIPGLRSSLHYLPHS